MTRQSTLAVSDASHVGQARRAAVRFAELADFSDDKRGRVAIIATELGQNLVKYGKSGSLVVQSVECEGRQSLNILAIDMGPGIADVQRSLQDGFSTGGTPGTGLGAVRRLSDAFDIHSTVGRGTVVFAACGATRRTSKEISGFEWTAFSTPAPREEVCGDAWSVLERDGGLRVMVADGLGHGPLAAEAAERAVRVFEEMPTTTPAEFCERAHQALQGSRGAALASAAIAETGHVDFASVGNVASTIVSEGRGRGLASQNGTIGLQTPRVHQVTYELPDRGVLIMHSDGLSNRWTLDSYQGLAARHSAVIAGVLFRDCSRGRDDATVVVIKRRSGR